MRDAKRTQSAYLARCCVGMGLFLAWTAGDVHAKTVAQISGVSASHLVDIVAGIGCNILVLTALVLMHKRVRSVACRWKLCVAAGAAAIAGPIIATFSCTLMPNISLLVVGAAMRGAAAALMFLAWSELAARMPLRQASICYAGAYAESVALQLAMGAVLPIVAMGIALACAVVSVVLLLAVSKSVDPANDAAGSQTREWTIPWRPLLLTAAYTLITFTFMHMLGSNGNGAIGRLGGGVVALVCLVGCVFFFDKHFDATSLGAAALPLAVAAMLLWCLAGERSATLVMTLADAGNVAFRIFVLSMLGNISYRYSVPALWLFGIVRIAMMGAEGCGLLLSMGMAASAAGESDFSIPACYAMILVLVLICTSAQDVRRISETSWNILGREEDGDAAAGKVGRLKAIMSEQELVLWQCAGVARTYGLTHREEEVLSYLVSGMTKTEIAEKLVLAESTVKTHIKHLYFKLSVHSRSEMLAVLSEQGRRKG